MKKYKKCAPGETVNSIRRILCGYNILLKEDYRELYDFHSCRLTLSDPNLESFNIGTNGKGRSFEYAMDMQNSWNDFRTEFYLIIICFIHF